MPNTCITKRNFLLQKKKSATIDFLQLKQVACIVDFTNVHCAHEDIFVVIYTHVSSRITVW